MRFIRSNERDSDEDHGSHGDGDNDHGDWDHGDHRDHGDHDRHGDGCMEKGDHDGMHYERKMAAIGVVLGIIVIAVIVIIVLCCCKKKNKRNTSVANLRSGTTAVPIKTPPRQVPAQHAGPMPEKNPKAFEALNVAALATAPSGQQVFGVAPPAYRSTVDLQEQTADPRDGVNITSPPPKYDA